MLVCSITVALSHSQEFTSNKENLVFFDNLINQANTKLYNGKRYYDLYKVSVYNHNFLNSPDYQKGRLTYDKQTFFDVDLKYDILKDVLVSKLSGQRSFINLELIKDKVSSFTIDNRKFINIDHLADSKDISGYVELASTYKSYQFFVKHKKELRERIKGNKIVYLFSERNSYFLYHNEKLHRIKSYKSLKKLFPDHSKTITTFYKSNKRLLDRNKYQFMVSLLKHLDISITNNVPKPN